MTKDKYANLASTPLFPADTAAEIVPDDESDLAGVTVARNLATPGSVQMTTRDGSVSAVNITISIVCSLRVRKVWARGRRQPALSGCSDRISNDPTG